MIETSSSDTNPNDDNLVLAATFARDWEAHLAKGILDENGIPSVIDNEIFASTLPLGFNSIGEIRLMVFSHDLSRARSILKTASLD